MIVTRQGKGSEVVALRPMQTGVSFSFDSLSDFLLIAEKTQLVSIIRETKPVDDYVSKLTGWRATDPCFYLTATRVVDDTHDETSPVAFVEIFLHGRYKKVGPDIGKRRYPVARQVEEMFGATIHEMSQLVRPTEISQKAAVALNAKPGTLGLRVERLYFGEENDILFAVVSHQIEEQAVVDIRMRYH